MLLILPDRIVGLAFLKFSNDFLLMCSHYSMSWHPFVFITPFPVSSVHQATPKLDLKGLTFRLPLSSSDYMNFLACVLHLAYSISPFPLPTLFSFFHCSQSPTLSSYFLPRPLLLALVILTLVPLPPRKYTFLQIASSASNPLNRLEGQRGACCLFVRNFGQWHVETKQRPDYWQWQFPLPAFGSLLG